MNQSQLFPPCSKAISGTKKEIGLSVTGAAQVEQTLLWELATLTREAVARAGIEDTDGKDWQQIISLLTLKFCADGSSLPLKREIRFFACCSSPFEKWNLLYPTGCQTKGTIKRLHTKPGRAHL